MKHIGIWRVSQKYFVIKKDMKRQRSYINRYWN